MAEDNAMLEGIAPPLRMVRVTNRNGFPLIDRHDGVPYRFMPREPLSIPPQVASHFFAWPGERDVRVAYMAKRYAWNRPTKDMEFLQADPGTPNDQRTLAEKYVDNFLLETIYFDLVARSSPEAAKPDFDPVSPMPEASYDAPVPLGSLPDETGTHAGRRKPGGPLAPKRLNV